MPAPAPPILPSTDVKGDVERHVDATAALLGLPLAPAHRPGVIAYFSLAAQFAQQVMDLPLGVEDEPAAVFVPVEPPR